MPRKRGRILTDVPDETALDTRPLHNIAMHRKRGGIGFDFPDEIILEIIGWLPAKDVLRLRSVCRRWRDLTSTQNFTSLHLRRCLPMVITQKDIWNDSGVSYDHYLLDQWCEPLQKTPKTYQFGEVSDSELFFSNGGLVVIGNYTGYMILNPMYLEKVHILFSGELFWRNEIYGVFFHPSLEEYCTLWRITESGDFTGYKILTLGSKPCWRDLNNPWSHLAKIRRILPILIDDHLYWVVEPKPGYASVMTLPADIMKFDIRNEEFVFIPSPIPRLYKCSEDNTNILDIGGLLSLVRISPSEYLVSDNAFEVNIWTLKDHERKVWTMSNYRINIDFYFSYLRPIALVNDELLLHDCGQLISYNLKLGTLRELPGKIYNDFILTTHVMSLVSLRNCKSQIYMDKRGEVEQNRQNRRWWVMVEKQPFANKRKGSGKCWIRSVGKNRKN